MIRMEIRVNKVDTGGGDGVRIVVCKYTDCFWSDSLGGRDGTGFSRTILAEVKEGDLVYFVIKIGEDPTFDATAFTVLIYHRIR
jgi:hypothetical protein